MSSYAIVVDAVGDALALSMFEAIANGNRLIISNFRISKKQYYTRLTKLQNSGLIRRIKGNYLPTMFGTIVYNALRIVEDASANRWKIEAVDHIKNTTTKEQTRQAIELLVTNHGVKSVLLGEVENTQG
jgi:hypothetical protein